jgi:hypothetical protein
MIHDLTRRQLAELRVAGHRPLLICDVDEVIVHFLRDFEDYLDGHGLWLDLSSLALNGNIRRKAGNGLVPDETVASMIDGFFAERTAHMAPVDGAVEALTDISRLASIVLLTNLPHSAGDHRRANMKKLGLPFPVITNSGPKGPAIRHLEQQSRGPVVFVDDSPNFIASAYEHAPTVHLVHFLHDERMARHVPPIDYVSLRTDGWNEALPHIHSLLSV